MLHTISELPHPITAVSTAANTGLYRPSPLHLLVGKAMRGTAKATWPSIYSQKVDSLNESDLFKSPADI